MNKFNKLKKTVGFTMVELLFVLVIIGILAAVAAPVFLGNSNKARASEAVATMGLIRQTLREEFINSNTYAELPTDKTIVDPIDDGGLGIPLGVTQYFSAGSFRVTKPATSTDHKLSGSPSDYVDFLIEVDGNPTTAATTNTECTDSVGTNCAVKAKEVEDFKLQMDNSGRIAISYGTDSSGNEIWQKY